MLGRFVVRRAGEEVPTRAFRGRQVRTLIRILVSRPDTFVSRDVLAEALWPERMPTDPSGNLSVLVRRARAALGTPSLIVTGPGGYSFVAAGECVVDAEMFRAGVNAGHLRLSGGDAAGALAELRAALGWWGGEPLAEDAYSDWAQDYRRTLLATYQQALEEGAQAAFVTGALQDAVALSEAAVAAEPLREPANLLLARSLAASGDSVAALRVLKALEEHFGEEGLSPSSETTKLQASIAPREFPVLDSESDRLQALESYEIVGSPTEAVFDDLAELAAQICQCPIGVVNFITKEYRWIKASYGLPAGITTEAPRGHTTCAWTINQPEVLVVSDATRDARFRNLPNVKAGYRFYAGAPLLTPEGHALGTVCVVDLSPRDLTAEQTDGLRRLARQAVEHLEQRRHIIRLRQAHDDLAGETKRTGELLARLLPAEVAAQLTDGGHVEPHAYDSVTVMVTNFCSFGRLATSLPPDELLEDLGRHFRAFDDITARHGLEGFKTVGDAYVGVGGLSGDHPDHAVQACRAALEIQDHLAAAPWQLRVGIHTGRLLVGVVGQNRLTYDIWGDAISGAARLQAAGAPGRINLSETTWHLIKHRFEAEPGAALVSPINGSTKVLVLKRAPKTGRS